MTARETLGYQEIHRTRAFMRISLGLAVIMSLALPFVGGDPNVEILFRVSHAMPLRPSDLVKLPEEVARATVLPAARHDKIRDMLQGLFSRESLPYEMFDVKYTDREARRAKRMESIYHVGQDRIWDGRRVLSELIDRHGRPKLGHKERHAVSQIFSVIMWGELAAWKISAQLANVIVPLEAKLAASSQVHDEARHFYVMHDYLEALEHKPPVLDYWSKRVLTMTLGTKSLAKKLLGMQLTIETIALTIFQRVRELDVEPVLSELLPYYERDEARHVGLGIQMLPTIVAEMSYAERIDLAVFHLDLYGSAVMSLKSLEPALTSIDVDPRSILAIGFRKQSDIDTMFREEFPSWPLDPPEKRIFAGLCELLFPVGGAETHVGRRERVRAAIDVMRRKRPGVLEIESEKRAGRRADNLSRAAIDGA